MLGWPSLVRATSGPGHYRLSPKAHYGELSRQYQQQKYEEVSLDDTVKRLGGYIHTQNCHIYQRFDLDMSTLESTQKKIHLTWENFVARKELEPYKWAAANMCSLALN